MALREGETSSSSVNDKPEQNSNRVIAIVFLALFIDLLGFALILPLFPSILDYYSRTQVRHRGGQPAGTASYEIFRGGWKKTPLSWGDSNSCRQNNNI